MSLTRYSQRKVKPRYMNNAKKSTQLHTLIKCTQHDHYTGSERKMARLSINLKQ
uniref:Uncharacterized protein n=1 Tax=Rhizophora mucronata TaxID=61149 RepID=A0A2P2QBA8_RHIMU